jgi:hypothetical protein
MREFRADSMLRVLTVFAIAMMVLPIFSTQVTACHYCGNGEIDPGEECEPPCTSNNPYCVCPAEDGCVGNDWYDYPDYGKCTWNCMCDVRTDDCHPCHPSITENDPRCMPTTTTTTTCPTTTTTTSSTTTTTVPTTTTTTSTTTTTCPTTTTTTVPTTTTTVPSGDDEDGGSRGGWGRLQACVINGICEEWEDANMCPSDCGTTTTTTIVATTTTTTTRPSAICGNGICEGDETQLTCPVDCIEITTTTTQPSGPSMPTGMFAAITGNLNILMMLLALVALILGIFRFKILPVIIKKK